MGSIYKRGRVYWIKYYLDGKAFYESSKSTQKANAKRLLVKREFQAQQGAVVSRAPACVYDDWKNNLVVYQNSNGENIQQTLEPVPFLRWYGMPCIYVLMQNQTCVYVGQSVNLPYRLQQHMKDFNKKFNKAFYFEAPKHLLDTVERDMITSLQPKYNKKNIKKVTKGYNFTGNGVIGRRGGKS